MLKGSRVVSYPTLWAFTSPDNKEMLGEVVDVSPEVPGGPLYRVAFDLEHRERLLDQFSCDWRDRNATEHRMVLGNILPDDYPGDQRVCLLLYGNEFHPAVLA